MAAQLAAPQRSEAGAPPPAELPAKPGAAVDDGLGEIQALYAWPSRDAVRVNLVLTVAPFAGVTTSFGPGFQYVFHVAALASPTQDPEPSNERLVICQFDSPTMIECWIGKTHLSGNPGASTEGLSSADGKIRVWAGRRSDPFFFNGLGLGNALAQLRQHVPGATPQCPAISPAQARDITTALRLPANNDRFAETNVLALALEINRGYLGASAARPFLAIWASTHRR
jgi:hypothetical protein